MSTNEDFFAGNMEPDTDIPMTSDELGEMFTRLVDAGCFRPCPPEPDSDLEGAKRFVAKTSEEEVERQLEAVRLKAAQMAEWEFQASAPHGMTREEWEGK